MTALEEAQRRMDDALLLRIEEAKGVLKTPLEHDLFKWLWGWDLNMRSSQHAIQVMIAEGWTWAKFEELWRRVGIPLNSYISTEIDHQLTMNERKSKK